MKTAQNPFTPLRREITLDIGNHKNQETKQHRYFYYIVNKKLNTAPNAPTYV